MDELEIPKKQLKLLDSYVNFNVEDLAKQITVLDAKLFKAIRVRSGKMKTWLIWK